MTDLRIDLDDSTAVAQLVATLRRDGMAMFDGAADRSGLTRFVGDVMHVWPHRDSDADGITTLHDRGDLARRPGLAGFGHDELPVHTESSTVERPPKLMMLVCVQGAGTGGQCRLVDGRQLYQELVSRDPELLADLSAPRSVLFGGASGYLGSVFEEHNGRTLVRLRLDDLARFSPQITRRLSAVRSLLRELEVAVTLTPGSGYLLCNTRWMHGRAAFTGDRLMFRLLGEPLRTLEIPSGFVASCGLPVTRSRSPIPC